MELKIRPLAFKYLLPTFSFLSLAGAVVVAGLTVNLAPATHRVLLTRVAIAEGQPITEDLVYEKELAIGETSNSYLGKFRPGLLAASSLAEGQLIPKRSVLIVGESRIPIRLNDLPQISRSISVGDSVDVWATPSDLSQNPQPVALAAVVVSVESNTSLGQATNSVEIRISPEYLETLLAALDSNYKISLILNETLSDLD